MKARLAFLSIALCLCLLAGWGLSGVEKPLQEEAPPEESQATTFCRVVQEEQGTLLLAEQGSTAVFTLTLGDQDMTLDGISFDPSAPGAYQALPGGSLAGTTVLVTHSGGFQAVSYTHLDVYKRQTHRRAFGAAGAWGCRSGSKGQPGHPSRCGGWSGHGSCSTP